MRSGSKSTAAHSADMTVSIAFVGAGPTTVYALAALLADGRRDLAVTVFETQATAGLGSPYRPGWNDAAMLSNIASIEIPPVTETLCAWLERLPAHELAALGIAADEIEDRTFYPRVTLGRYFHAQFDRLVDRARAMGIGVEVRVRSRVIDVAEADEGMRVTIAPRRGAPYDERFDYVVLATGHQWPAEPQVRPGYFVSPWPVTALADVPAVPVGIRGSSLTAIDVAVALAVTHGAFVEADAGGLSYTPAPDTEGFYLTMMSRKGLLPEADFYCPIPYEPLDICTPEAIEGLIADGETGLLDAAFELFRRQLVQADPVYATETGLVGATLEQFCERYFLRRSGTDAFDWARTNLDEARRNLASEVTVPWRYAILRMHEALAPIVPHLDDDEFQRFNHHFKPIFVDDYGAVPHQSIERMLALHRAGKLSVLALGEDYRIDSHVHEGGAELRVGKDRHRFPVFIEATGQRPLPARQFPFPSLLQQGIIRDEAANDTNRPARGIVIDDLFHPMADDQPVDRLFCLSLPFIMGRHPFVQGITSSHEMGTLVGVELAQVLDAATTVVLAGAEAA